MVDSEVQEPIRGLRALIKPIDDAIDLSMQKHKNKCKKTKK
jgi:hypothetical protein